jgi:hypothetical protein
MAGALTRGIDHRYWTPCFGRPAFLNGCGKLGCRGSDIHQTNSSFSAFFNSTY